MNYQQVKSDILNIVVFIIEFYKDPFKTVEKVPQWRWLSLFTLILLFSAATGLLRGLFSATVLQIFVGVFFLPLSCALSVFVISGLLYYSIALTQKRFLNFKRLCTLVFIVFIPTLTMYVFSLIHPAVTLIGVSMSFLLLAIGLHNRFQINKKFVQLFIGFFYALFLISWFSQYLNIDSNKKTQQFLEINERNEEILQKELSQ